MITFAENTTHPMTIDERGNNGPQFPGSPAQENSASLYSGEKDVEVFRIAQQNAIYNVYANRLLDGLFLSYEAPDVLDIGCSDGKNINLRLKGRSYRSLLGIDIDPDKIRQAADAFRDPRQSFSVMNVSDPGFPDQLRAYLAQKGLDGFHIIHISSVLMHVGNPEAVLGILRTFLTADGTLFIQDEDDGLNLAYPPDGFFTDAFYLWEHSLESGDRHFARKLPGFLAACGYRDIELKSACISSLDCQEGTREAFWDLYFNCDLWSADSPAYFDNAESLDKLSVYRERHPSYRQAFLDGKYFILLGVFFLTAKR